MPSGWRWRPPRRDPRSISPPLRLRHPDPTRKAIFFGDFIDRGPDQARVLDIARRIVGEGEALAELGNHELNALHYAGRHPDTGAPLRAHSPKNADQHRTFLDAFPLGSPAACDVLGWLQTLPLLLDMGRFRIAHAAWAEPATPTAVLDDALLVRAADLDDLFGAAVEAIAKGPEVDLPVGFDFVDKGGPG
jgi:hypothetical protein